MKTLIARTLLFTAVLLTGCPEPLKPLTPPAAPVITSFEVTPSSTPMPGETVTLRWATTDATSISLEALGKGPLAVDGALTEGSLTTEVDADTVFLLTARGPGGTTSRGAGVTVSPAPMNPVFTAVPPEVLSGQPTSLVWSARGATAVSLRAVGGADLDLLGQREFGSVTVTPSRTTTYELTVDGRTATTTVNVLPVVFDFALVGQAPLPGEQLTLGWRTGGGETVTLARAGVTQLLTTATGAAAAQGTFVDTAPASLPRDGVLDYTLTLTSGTRSVTRTLVVRLDGGVVIDAFIAPSYARAGDTLGISWRTTGATQVELRVQGQPYYTSPDALAAANGGVSVPMIGASVTVELVARNDRGGSARLSRTIAVVGAPVANAFGAAPATIANGGEPVVLSWDVTNARNVRIYGPGNELMHQASGLVDTGSVTLYPNDPTVTYELRADNGAGDAITARQATVNVTSPARLTFSGLGPVGALTNVTGTTVSSTGMLTGLPTVQRNLPGEAFVDISTTGVNINYSGTSSALVTLPETFSTVVYGQRVNSNTISVSINGWFFFSPTAVTGTANNSPFPATGLEPLAIAPYWEDLYNATDTDIFFQLDGTGSNRRLIVQWNEVEHDAYANSKLTFQAQVYASGKITFAYALIEDVLVNDPSVGIVSPGETDALTPGLAPQVNDVFTFGAPQSPPVPVTIDGFPMRARAQLGSSFIDVGGNPFSTGVLPDGGLSVCGNGELEPGEACDDDDTDDGDGCSALCVVEDGYQCLGAPLSSCTPRCGDGIVLGTESCDDTDTDSNDGCTAACTVEAGYTCSGSPSRCTPVCGDGLLGVGEACDDRNTTPSDGCSATCTVEERFACSGTPSSCLPVGLVTTIGVNGTGANAGHMCLTTSLGRVFCSGVGTAGQLGDGTLAAVPVLSPAPVPNIDDAVEVAVGSNFSCLLRDAGTVSCWGDNAGLQLGRGGTSTTDSPTPLEVGTLPAGGAPLTGVVDVEAGDLFACARLANGTVSCWGDNLQQQQGLSDAGTTDRSYATPVQTITQATGLTTGGAHSCAVIADGGLLCWGDNASGQIGIGGTATADISVPRQPTGLPAVTQACAGDGFTCAVTAGSAPALYCWGINTNGQLGTGNTTTARAPTLVPNITPRSVACGEQHTCVVDGTGRVSCWGQNNSGQLGDGVPTLRTLTPVAVAVPLNPIELRLGYSGSCALYADGSRVCWGNSEAGQLGIGVPFLVLDPTPLAISDVKQVSTATGGYRISHACARTGNGDLHCFGDNDYGQLGDGTTTPRLTPTPVPSLAGAVKDVAVTRNTSSTTLLVTTGQPSSCVVLVDGGVQCWGGNNEGQLGDGTQTAHATPATVTLPSEAMSVAAGDSFYCVTSADEQVRCWGNNSSGQLGAPTATSRFLSPTTVAGLTGALQVAAGQDHLCARFVTGEVACLGENASGQLGINSTTDSATAVMVPNLAGVDQLCAGIDHTCALINDGTVRCWGENNYGQMGTGNTTDVRVPTVVPGLTGVTQVACGGNFVCGVLADGSVRCLGYGEEGQLGNRNITTTNFLAVPMIGVSNAASVSLGNSSSFIVGTDGTLRSVGFVGSGQLGIGLTNRPITPVVAKPF